MRADLDIFLENKKNSLEMKIVQLKNQALKDIQNTAVKIAIDATKNYIKNDIDKQTLSDLQKLSIQEIKETLQKTK